MTRDGLFGLRDEINLNHTRMLEDIKSLVSINTTRDESSITQGAPFGAGIRKAFDALISIARREGLEIRDHEGYAVDISYGEGNSEVAILNHIDVVPEGDIRDWRYEPFDMTIDGDYIYGRGVTDNKGPLVASLYLLIMVKKLNLPVKHKIRLIVGGAEETTWECIEHYFKHNPQPDYGFSPDGDFPIVNGEKGIYYCELTKSLKEYAAGEGKCSFVSICSELDETTTCHELVVLFRCASGFDSKTLEMQNQITRDGDLYKIKFSTKREKSRNPHKAKSAICEFVNFFKRVEGLDSKSKFIVTMLDDLFVDSYLGGKLGLYHRDEEMGTTTCCVSSLNVKNDELLLNFDFRFPKGLGAEQVPTRLNDLSGKHGMTLHVRKYMPLSHIPSESHLVKTIGKAFENVTGIEPECFSKGGASYARALTNGVAFGPTFQGEITHVHDANERLNVSSLKKAMIIYLTALMWL